MNYVGPAIATALSHGFDPVQIIQQLTKTDKKLAKKIKAALEQGFSPDEVVNNLQGKSYGERTARSRNYTSQEVIRENVKNTQNQKNSTALKAAGTAATLAGATAAAAYGGPAMNVIGGYLSGQLGRPQTPPPAPTGGAPGQAALQAPAPTPGLPSGVAGSPQGTPSPSTSTGGGGVGSFLKALVPTVAGYFGFKNKALVNAVANLVENTGKDVASIYNDLADQYDISTPEKAAAAAESLFKRIEKGEDGKGVTYNAKPIEETKKDFARDLKSAVIRKTEYDEKANRLKVIFNNDSTYEYADVPLEIYEKLTEGGIKAKTSGENEFGKWWVGKDPSLGASFNELIKKGGYNFTRGPNSPLSEQEREELIDITDKQKKSTGILDTTEKTTNVAGKERFKGKPEKQLTSEQIRNRRLLLEKQLSDIKKMPREQRTEQMIESVNERLRALKDLNQLMGSKKSKVISEEIMRRERREGKNLIKKMLVLLPAAVVKTLKAKMETSTEEEMLKMIKEFLKTQRK